MNIAATLYHFSPLDTIIEYRGIEQMGHELNGRYPVHENRDSRFAISKE